MSVPNCSSTSRPAASLGAPSAIACWNPSKMTRLASQILSASSGVGDAAITSIFFWNEPRWSNARMYRLPVGPVAFLISSRCGFTSMESPPCQPSRPHCGSHIFAENPASQSGRASPATLYPLGRRSRGDQEQDPGQRQPDDHLPARPGADHVLRGGKVPVEDGERGRRNSLHHP